MMNAVSELDVHLLALLAASLARVRHSTVIVSHSTSRIDSVLKCLKQIDANCTDYTLHLASSRSSGETSMKMSEKLAQIDVESRYDAMVNVYANVVRVLIERRIDSKSTLQRVVACTLSTVCNHLLFGKQRFNAVIVDVGECSIVLI